MATMNVSLPDPMKDWVEAQIDSGKYASSSDYVRELIRQDQKDHEKMEALQKAITEGLQSGVSDKSMDDLLKEARKRVAALRR